MKTAAVKLDRVLQKLKKTHEELAFSLDDYENSCLAVSKMWLKEVITRLQQKGENDVVCNKNF